MTTSATLGQLAVHQGLIEASALRELSDQLRASSQQGEPTSMARLLIASGLEPEAVRAVLACGLALDAVACDGCATPIPQSELNDRSESPCPQCGCMVLGFRAFAPDEVAGAVPRRVTAKMPGKTPEAPLARATTDRYPHVLSLPKDEAPPEDDSELGETGAYARLIPLPPADQGGPSRESGARPTPSVAEERFEELIAEPVDAEWLSQAPAGLGMFRSGEGDFGGATLSPDELAKIKREVEQEEQQEAAAAAGSAGTRRLGDAEQARLLRGEVAPSEPEAPDGTLLLAPGQVAEVLNRPAPADETNPAKGSGPPAWVLVVILLVLIGVLAVGVALLLESK